MRLRTAALLALALALTGCGGGGSPAERASDACVEYSRYGRHESTTVSVTGPIRNAEADKLLRSWNDFEDCTGITVDYDGIAAFEQDLKDRTAAGRPPDLALFPQPGLIADMAHEGGLQPVSADVQAHVQRWWSQAWQTYGTVDGKLYAAPLNANIKSLVWYSPSFFAEHGYSPPTSWDELMRLTERIAAAGVKPWCAGAESGAASGFPITDWLEDVLLRTSGPQVYDDWVAHRIPFNDKRIVEALDRAGAILRDPRYVNGGYGGVQSIATVAMSEGGLPILQGTCAMHRQASFYANEWPDGTRIAPDGDVYAFYLPRVDPAGPRVVLGAGEFVGAFTTRPEVQAVAAYLSTPQWADRRARLGGAVSANQAIDRTALRSPIEQLSAELLTDPDTVFRFDASDMMPATVGTGTFWTGMIDWLNGKPTKDVLDAIEQSWPAG
ncbi:carbohydrate ABC transporter substrate-binding protein [Dactylosporangium vinaceum]|uniref:ABC transporter substrate-binding protein n=1 Tax=Dactylosporangium vinaceum TaxID=53362 RepID=A0ABV5MG31_9ACTN|nr:ABC transporter substrate-binding protein [Dactylosporangium vinaceum]UAB98932.1 carbohydrate ABC transporter substrate-binding protein [Dactylosporangium vinaceum]